jgi:hypothetical protein
LRLWQIADRRSAVGLIGPATEQKYVQQDSDHQARILVQSGLTDQLLARRSSSAKDNRHFGCA